MRYYVIYSIRRAGQREVVCGATVTQSDLATLLQQDNVTLHSAELTV